MRFRTMVFVALIALTIVSSSVANQALKKASDDSHAHSREHAHELLLGTLWMRTAGEYFASATQVYRTARLRLDEALRDPEWTAYPEQRQPYALPPAVIMDLDETVLDNTGFEVEMIESNTEFNAAMWTQWVNEKKATAVPGAVDFINYAQSRGVRVFFVTNRKAHEESATRANLRELGVSLSDADDEILTRGEQPEWRSDKESRRSLLAKQYRILLNIGDNLNDFLSGAHSTPEERMKLAVEHKDLWGKQWLLLPNPIYGTWEQSLYDFDYSLSYAEKLRRKYRHLTDHR